MSAFLFDLKSTTDQVMYEIICRSIANRKRLQFKYEFDTKIVEPHTLGMDKEEDEVLLAYQIAGGSQNGELPGWELFELDKIQDIKIIAETFSTVRPGFRRGDSRMIEIYCEL